MRLGRITFVAWDGEPAADQRLDEIPPATGVFRIVQQAFQGYLAEDAVVQQWDGFSSLQPPVAGFHLVYVYGHAWLTAGVPVAAWRTEGGSGGSSDRRSGSEAPAAWLAKLVPDEAAQHTLLVLDCCHAAAFDRFIVSPHQPRLTVYACGAEESAIALLHEQASRLSLAWSHELSKARGPLDLARAVAAIAERLDRDGVLHGQSVSYRMNGPSVKLGPARAATVGQRERTVGRMRNMLLGAGGLLAAAGIALGRFYWSHVLVDLELAGLSAVASDIHVLASEELPADNNRVPLVQRAVQGERIRLWLPASNLLLRVQARYPDGAERALHLHVLEQPGFDLQAKLLHLRLPPASAVQAHPGMAYVPASPWYHGQERERHASLPPFWIDLRPPTVAEYEPVARQLLASGALKEDNSFVLRWRQRSAAIEAVGLQQLRGLSRDLGAIMGIVAASGADHAEAPGDIVVGTGTLPCGQCPVPMTRLEAGVFCASRGMRVPTSLEWELAARGVDGRLYPWGNRLDRTRANLPGMPGKGEEAPQLRPVDAYPAQKSPYGLLDTVGNAGDWVVNATGSYERVYMGATYRFKPEDATTFQLLLVTEEDALVREITVRCVVDAAS